MYRVCNDLLGSEEKLQVCAKNGADLGINYKTHNFADEVLKATGNKGTASSYYLSRWHIYRRVGNFCEVVCLLYSRIVRICKTLTAKISPDAH